MYDATKPTPLMNFFSSRLTLLQMMVTVYKVFRGSFYICVPFLLLLLLLLLLRLLLFLFSSFTAAATSAAVAAAAATTAAYENEASSFVRLPPPLYFSYSPTRVSQVQTYYE